MTTIGIPISSLANGTILSNIQVEARGQLINAAIPAEGATVYAYVHEAGYLPTSSSTRAQVFADEFLTTPLPQPLMTDENGVVPGYVAPGQFIDLLVSGGALAIPQVLLLNTQAASAVSGDATGTLADTVVATVLGGQLPVAVEVGIEADLVPVSNGTGGYGWAPQAGGGATPIVIDGGNGALATYISAIDGGASA